MQALSAFSIVLDSSHCVVVQDSIPSLSSYAIRLLLIATLKGAKCGTESHAVSIGGEPPTCFISSKATMSELPWALPEQHGRAGAYAECTSRRYCFLVNADCCMAAAPLLSGRFLAWSLRQGYWDEATAIIVSPSLLPIS